MTPSVSCGRFDLRCTKILEERIHLGTPPFTEDALKRKQNAAHTPDSSSFAENHVEMDSEGFIEDAQELKLWPNRIALAFIQLMVEDVKQDPSLTKKNSFTTRHWTRIDDELYSQQAYNTFVKLKNRTRFDWDEQRKTVMALDDVWDHYVKAHPRAKVFRKKGLDHSQATGALARASTQGPPTSDEERDIQSAFFGVGINLNTDSFPIDDNMDGDDDPKVGGSCDPKVGGSSGNDGGRKGAHFDFALDTWTATNLAKKEFFARQNKMAEASQAEKKQNSIAACIQCLATMDEITPDQYVKACESFRDKAMRKMFMLMLPNMQLHWEMDPSQSNEFPNYDNITAEMDSSGESLETEDSADSEDSPDSADLEDSEDSIAAQLRSSFIASDNDDLDFAMVCQMWEATNGIPGKQPQRTCPYIGEMYTQHLLNGHPRTIREVLRMDAPTFRSLCDELKIREFIKVDKNRALCRLAVLIIRPPDPNVIPPEIRNNRKHYPWFKDCIGAIDGTHIAAHAPTSKRTAYRSRKVALTQNVLAACSFDLKFTFVYPSWEGSATDSRVLSDALTRPDVSFPLPPTGKYYLVDAGFTNMTGFLAPYRSERYHLDQFRGGRRRPNGYKELFNYRHSSLRNVIERSFGVLKNRFPILRSMPNYMQIRQGTIVTACYACHNWIRMHSTNDPWFNRLRNAHAGQAAPVTPAAGISNEADEAMNEMVELRDEIATAIWNNHRVRP
ncbi:unnamed protein product [Camellia sinensis]